MHISPLSLSTYLPTPKPSPTQTDMHWLATTFFDCRDLKSVQPMLSFPLAHSLSLSLFEHNHTCHGRFHSLSAVLSSQVRCPKTFSRHCLTTHLFTVPNTHQPTHTHTHTRERRTDVEDAFIFFFLLQTVSHQICSTVREWFGILSHVQIISITCLSLFALFVPPELLTVPRDLSWALESWLAACTRPLRLSACGPVMKQRWTLRPLSPALIVLCPSRCNDRRTPPSTGRTKQMSRLSRVFCYYFIPESTVCSLHTLSVCVCEQRCLKVQRITTLLYSTLLYATRAEAEAAESPLSTFDRTGDCITFKTE